MQQELESILGFCLPWIADRDGVELGFLFAIDRPVGMTTLAPMTLRKTGGGMTVSTAQSTFGPYDTLS